MIEKAVLTLIAPEAGGLTETLVTRAESELRNAGAMLLGTTPLEAGRACDIAFTRLTPEKANAAVRALAQTAKVDAVAQDAAARGNRRLLICDMDSTVIGQECIDELADFAGFRDEVAAITERAMNGELDFEEALRARVRMLAGLEESVLQRVFDERITITPGIKELTAAMKRQGAKCILVSGGFTFFTERVAAAAGFTAHYANRLEIREGKLTGEVAEPILGKEAKLQRLTQTCAQMGATPAQALAVGDGANDLPMLLAAGLGVAYRAKPAVREAARARIDCCDLSALVYVMGLTDSRPPPRPSP